MERTTYPFDRLVPDEPLVLALSDRYARVPFVADRRVGRGVHYPLPMMFMIAVLANLSGHHHVRAMAQALRLCPDLLVVSPNFAAYRTASQQVMERVRRLTPLVDQVSIDEAFLDVTSVSEPGDVLAVHLQATIQDELALSCSLGVATNKLVATVATDVGKSLVRSGKMPQALCVILPGEEAAFRAAPNHTALWGVDPKTAKKLTKLGIYTIGDIMTRSAGGILRPKSSGFRFSSMMEPA